MCPAPLVQTLVLELVVSHPVGENHSADPDLLAGVESLLLSRAALAYAVLTMVRSERYLSMPIWSKVLIAASRVQLLEFMFLTAFFVFTILSRNSASLASYSW